MLTKGTAYEAFLSSSLLIVVLSNRENVKLELVRRLRCSGEGSTRALFREWVIYA